MQSKLRGATICSGIGAPETAWPWMDWRWCAEIEKFPCAVLAQRHPDSVNLGDITKADFIARSKAHGPLDVLVAGTPCQAFSIAGNRGSLSDERGNLTLRFAEIVDAIQPRFILWENVPGVLSTKDNAFGCFLGALAGTGAPLVPGRNQRWTHCGVVDGPKRRIAWRIQCAQWHGVAQRRERVFVVASLRDEAHPAEVLFECEGLQRHTAPRRETREAVTGTLSARTQGGGGLGTDFDIGGGSYQLSPALTASGRGTERTGESRGQDCLIPVGLSNGDVSHCLNADGMGRINYETETLVTHALTDEGFDASEDGTGRESPLEPVAIPILEAGARTGKSTDDIRAGSGIGTNGDPMFTLQSGKQHAVAVAFDTTQITSAANYSNPKEGDPCHPLAATAHPPALAFRAAGQDDFTPSQISPPIAESDGGGAGVPTVMAFNLRGREDGAMPEVAEVASLRSASGGSSRSYLASDAAWAVRRLTPVECERLQSFEDGFTDVLYNGKQAADGLRYKSLGNSMNVNVIRWIGKRLRVVMESECITTEQTESEHSG